MGATTDAPRATMKLPILTSKLLSIVIGLCLAPVVRLAAQGAGSLKNLDLESAEEKVAIETLSAENKALRDKLATAESALTALQENFGSVSSEAEVFRRMATELNVRLEALGTGKLDDRLIKLLGELKFGEGERTKLRDALIGLSEAVLRYEKLTVSNDPSVRLDLEAAMRDCAKALGITSTETIIPAPIPSTLTDGMVVSFKEDLALIVVNLGSRHGVKIGMPFEVIRNRVVIGTVRIVDVRDKIAGALIQNLSDKETVKVGDRLKIAAQK